MDCVAGPARTVGAPVRCSLVLTGLGAVLLLVRPDVGALRAGLPDPHAWVARDGSDAVAAQLATTVAWLATAWLAIGLLAGLLGRLPGVLGGLGRTVSGGMLPAVVRAGLVGALGVSLATAPAAATAGPVTSTACWSAAASSPPSAHWPTGREAPRPLPWPGEQTHPRPDPPPSTTPPAHGTVIVRPGDSLWSLAAFRLGPGVEPGRVAAEWPRWYAANRSVIGGDPGLIRPGQHLVPPPNTPPTNTPPPNTPPPNRESP